jgi:apolipoprotein N-acyltransferase
VLGSEAAIGGGTPGLRASPRTQAAVLVSFSILSAALATLSLPSFHFGFLGWIALAPLLFALRQRGLVASAGLGGLFGYAFGVGTFFWITTIPELNITRFALLMGVFALYYVAFGFSYALVARFTGSWIILWGPALGTALEYARCNFSFFAFPWNFLAHSQHQTLPVIQIADVTGMYGVTFVLLVVNQLVSQTPDLLGHRNWHWRAQGVAVSVVLGVTLGYGWYKLGVAPQSDAHLRVALVQANVTARSNMSVDDQMKHLSAYEGLTWEAAKQKPDLIVWPSSSLPGPITFWPIRFYVSSVADSAKIPLLVGGAGGDKLAPARDGLLPYSNSEFLIGSSGELEGQYNKIRLTPFSEQVPFQGLVPWPHWITTLEKSFVPGDSYTLFQVSKGRFGAPICWENNFPDVFRRFVLDGANFMVSVTNESVFGPTSGPHQTFAMVIFRAIENRVAVARAATTGVSAFIDAQGRIVSRVSDGNGGDLFVRGTLIWDVPLSQGKTFYTQHGDVFVQALSVATLVLLAVCLWRSRRKA